MEGFIEAIHLGIRTLDKLIDENYYRHPLKEQQEMSYNYRNVGLGVFGYATALMKMGFKYGSKEAIDWTNRIFESMFREAVKASSELATKFGSFPKYKPCVFDSDIVRAHFSDSEIETLKEQGLRNCSLLSEAPNGSLATLLNESGGCEPEFALSYKRRTVGMTEGNDTYYDVYCKAAREYMEVHHTTTLPDYFVGSADIPWRDRVISQATMQKHIDTAISSTVNLPSTITKDDIAQMYLLAWKSGCKGITMFRDGCKRLGILTNGSASEPKPDSAPVLKRGTILSCSNGLVGKKRKLTTGCVDGETEFFNGKGWVKISEYQCGDLVLQYNKDGTTNLTLPTNYIKRETRGMYHINTKYGLDMMLSPDHRNVTFNNNLSRPKIMTTQEIIEAHQNSKTGFTRKFKKSFFYDGSGIDLTDEEIRISVAIFADGCFYSPTSKKCLISVHKKRKRDRLVELLNKANIEFSENFDKDKYYNIKFYPPIDGEQKTFPLEWYNCSHHQFMTIFDEVFNWDGYAKEKNQYTTINKSNADFIQFVCSSLGKSASIFIDERNKTKCYRVDWSNRTLRSFAQSVGEKEIPFVRPSDGYDYCFSVPSTMLVLRRNNNIFITGNCGSLHVLAYFDPVSAELQEVYLAKGSTGGCANFMAGLSRTLSLLCRAGVEVYDIKDQLDSTGACPSYAFRTATKHDTSKGSCCPMAIGNALIEMYEEMREETLWDEETETKTPLPSTDEVKYSKCPECGENSLISEGGCNSCKSCGYSKCD